MVELAPAAFLDAPWPATQQQLAAASALLRRGLEGADVCFMFQVRRAPVAGRAARVRGWTPAFRRCAHRPSSRPLLPPDPPQPGTHVLRPAAHPPSSLLDR